MKLKEIENKLPLGIAGIILSILGIYLVFVQLKPSLTFEIIQESNVFNIYKQVEDLNITFQNKDLKKSNQNLRTYKIRVVNDSFVDIRYGDFDPNMDFGIELNNGTFLNEIGLIKSNSKYINKQLKIKKISNNIININKLIFESGKFFIFEIIVLHDKNSEPELKTLGKIAGIEEIKVLNLSAESKNISFLSDILDANILTHIFRLIVYSLTLIVVIILIIFILEFLSRNKYHNNNTKVKLELINILGDDIKDLKMSHFINLLYKSDLEHLKNRINEINTLKKDDDKIILYLKHFDLEKKDSELNEEKMNFMRDNRLIYQETDIWNDLLKSKIIRIDNNELIVNETFLKNQDVILEKAYSIIKIRK